MYGYPHDVVVSLYLFVNTKSHKLANYGLDTNLKCDYLEMTLCILPSILLEKDV
jgi:hypothetical protein